MASDQPMEEMELDAMPPPPPPQQLGYADYQLRLAKVHHAFVRVEARVAEVCRYYGEIIAAINAVAAQVGKLRRLRAEGLVVDLAAPVREVEWAFGRLSAEVRRIAAMRGAAVEMARFCPAAGGGGGGGEAADALADALQRINL